MTSEDRVELFDRWAASYDRAVERAGFPFEGYGAVLGTIVARAEVERTHRVLDVGIGTGNLARQFAPSGCEIWGVDFSDEMIERARVRLPIAHIVRADLHADWPEALPKRFDRIVSAYVFHEFPDDVRLQLIGKLFAHLASSGRAILGDIAFPNREARDASHREWAAAWDEEEHYWTASTIRPALEARGLHVEYRQVSFCGGVFVFRRAETR